MVDMIKTEKIPNMTLFKTILIKINPKNWAIN